MAQTEGGAEGSAQLREKVLHLATHNQTLGANLETNARVIEKLIDLNTELMDSRNLEAFGHTTRNGDVAVPVPTPVPVSQGPVSSAATPSPGPAGGGAEIGAGAEAAAALAAGRDEAKELRDAFADFLLEEDDLSPRKAADLVDPPGFEPRRNGAGLGGLLSSAGKSLGGFLAPPPEPPEDAAEANV